MDINCETKMCYQPRCVDHHCRKLYWIVGVCLIGIPILCFFISPTLQNIL